MTTDSAAPVLRFSVALEPSHLLRARERLRDYLRLHCADEELVDDVVLCLEEACTNAIRHSGASEEMQITLHFEGDELQCQVSDHGKGFDVAAFDPAAAPDLLASGGRGLYIISQIMDEMSLRLDGGLEVHMRKRGVPRCEVQPPQSGLGDLRAAGDLDYRDTRVRAMLEEIDEAFVALDWEYRYVHVNEAMLRLTRMSRDELLGRVIWELFPQLQGTAVRNHFARAMELGIPSVFEHRAVVTGDWLEIRIYPTSVGVSAYYREINQRKLAETHLRESEELSAFLLLLNDALKPLADPVAMQETASRLLGEHLKADRAAYFEIDGDDCVIERDWAPSVPHLSGRFRGAAFGEGLLSTYQSGRMVVMNDVAEDPLTPQEREAYAGIQVAAQISTPLMKDGTFVGGLTVHSAVPRTWTRHEMRLLEETAERTWAAVAQARAESAQRESERRLRIAASATKRELAASRLLANAATTAAATLSLKTICERIIESIRGEAKELCAGSIYSVEDDRQTLRHIALFGYPEETLPEIRTLQVAESSNLGRLVLHGYDLLTEGTTDEAPESAERRARMGLDHTRWLALPVRRGDELLAVMALFFEGKRPFAQDEIGLYQGVAAILGNAIANARSYETQRDIALTLQESLLHPLPQVPGLKFATRSLPANQAELVGGDFSDVFVVEDGRVAMLIGDVAGKGVRAAGLTETVRTAVRAFSGIDSGPAFILRKANELLLRHESGEPHVTACLCLIDPATGHVCVGSAGHPAPVRLTARSCQIMDLAFGPPLGSFPHDYGASHVVLTFDDYLVLYTDGVTEARHDGELFGEDRLIEVVEGLRGSSVDTMAQGIADATLAFGGKLRDDLQIVVARLA